MFYACAVPVFVLQELQDTAADVVGVDKYHQVCNLEWIHQYTAYAYGYMGITFLRSECLLGVCFYVFFFWFACL